MMAPSGANSKRKKARRALRACDFCSQRSIKCAASETDTSRCENCEDYDQPCTFDRPVKKRGAKPKRSQGQHTVASGSDSVRSGSSVSSAHRVDGRPVGNGHRNSATASSLGTPREHQEPRRQPASNQASRPNTIATPKESPDGRLDASQIAQSSQMAWQPDVVATQAVIMDLAEVYFDIVGPVFPFFHRPSLLRRVSRCEYWSDRPLYASVMAMCALTSARIRDGALYSKNWTFEALQEPSSETFFEAARKAMPDSAPLTHTFDFGYTRACALLALVSIQYGKSNQMNYWSGMYHTYISVGRFHDEDQWPQVLDPVEVEERRRVFWSMYTLDVFTSVIWGGIVRSRESSFNVGYPTEINDECFNKDGYNEIDLNGSVNWLTGWNFVTDLYRVLEHAQDNFRSSRTPDRRTPFVKAAFGDTSAKQADVLNHVMGAYASLPDIFKTTRPITGDLRQDLFSFQAANIAATMQLVRMMLFTTKRSTTDEKCQIAREVISGFASVPNAYLRAISVPLLHHLAGIGSILGSAFEDGLSKTSYQMVRAVLLSLANLLANFEIDLCCPSGTADKLRSQVSRMDEYMSRQYGYPQPVRSSVHSDTQLGVEDRVPTNTLYEATLTSPPTDQSLFYTGESPHVFFPDELFKDWSWTFDNI